MAQQRASDVGGYARRRRPRTIPWKHLLGAGMVAGLAFSVATPAAAWSAKGHQVIADIAWQRMTPRTRDAVMELMARVPDSEGRAEVEESRSPEPFVARPRTFRDLSTWADAYRYLQPQTAGWHFIALPLRDGPPPSTSQVCQDGLCIVTALRRALVEVRDPRMSDENRAKALAFIVHLVGDLHDPMHTVDNGDRAGNCVRVTIEGAVSETSLHALWDTVLVNDLGPTADSIVRRLQPRITPALERDWSVERLGDWVVNVALDSNAIASLAVYQQLGIGEPRGCRRDPLVLARRDREAFSELAAVQLEKAGVRLAEVLNTTLGAADVAP